MLKVPTQVEGVVQRTATKYLGREVENATNWDDAACGRYLDTRLRIPFGFDHSLSQSFTGSEDAMHGALQMIQRDLTERFGSDRSVALAVFDRGRSISSLGRRQWEITPLVGAYADDQAALVKSSANGTETKVFTDADVHLFYGLPKASPLDPASVPEVATRTKHAYLMQDIDVEM